MSIVYKEYYEAMLERMPGAFLIYEAHGDENILYANKQLIKMFECDDFGDFLKLTNGNFKGMVYSQDYDRVKKEIWSQIESRQTDNCDYVDYRIVTKYGKICYVLDNGRLVDDPGFGDVFYVTLLNHDERGPYVMDDFSAKKMSDNKLIESEKILEQYRLKVESMELLHETLHSGPWNVTFTEEGKLKEVFWSPVFRQMLGYQDELDFPNKMETFINVVHDADKDRIVKKLQEVLNDTTDAISYDEEFQIRTKNRGLRWFRAAGKPARREDGTPKSFVGLFQDIDDLKKKEQALEKQREECTQNLRIFGTLSKIYHSVYLIDFEQDTIDKYDTLSGLQPVLEKGLVVDEIMREIVKKNIADDGQKEIFDFTNLKSLLTRMKGKEFLMSEFEKSKLGRFVASFVAIEQDKDGYPTQVLFTTQLLNND
ncbi:MAG: PAS domain-containing protein [Eubacterium sp.]|nr:PAS domain-containing protein [Eubacterium sp.]